MMAAAYTYRHEARVLLSFLLLYAGVFFYVKTTHWREPTSVFFQPERAYSLDYSAFRISQANSYADWIATGEPRTRDRKDAPKLCIGTSSIRREGISYLKSTIGSLQHGLTKQERDSLYFVVLLAHTDQSKHQDFSQPWLEHMVDRLPTYQDDPEILREAQDLESYSRHVPKQIFDVSLVLEECAKVNPDYIMLVEDDVVAMDGWLHRTLHALEEASNKSAELGQPSFLYLRLFYYESLLGWNSEEWPIYLRYSIAAAAGQGLVLCALRFYWPAARKFVTRPLLAAALLVCAPLCVGLFFAAGQGSVLPLAEGVGLMPRYACCAQGLVFPGAEVAAHVGPLLRRARARGRDPRVPPIDSLIEEWADARPEERLRWAVTPVVLQHVGGKSSHGVRRESYGVLTPYKIFNFGFERNNPEKLAEEQRVAMAANG